MPIPIIIGAVAAAAGLYGIAKGVGGAKDHSNAKDINQSAKNSVDETCALINQSREATNSVIEDYGQRKLRAFNGIISEFIDTSSCLPVPNWKSFKQEISLRRRWQIYNRTTRC